jgi:cupin fold WbuC family metalloprotein
MFSWNGPPAIRENGSGCAHTERDDKVHEMLIVHERDCYVRPHKHLGKSEAFHIVTGLVDIALLDDDGEILEVVPMGDYASGRKFYYRLADPWFHTLLIRSDRVVFHEITSGPFNPADTLFARWSPEDADVERVRDFVQDLDHRVAAHLKTKVRQ